MIRPLVVLVLLAGAAGACRHYDGYGPLQDQSGSLPPPQFARFGAEQAQAVAIGRSLAQWYGGTALEARRTQTAKASDYARTLRDVVSVVPDSLGYRLTVAFKSGWIAAIVPIDDGVQPEDTPGLPSAQ